MALDTVVVGNAHRPPVITEALGGVSYRFIETPDEMLPPGFAPARESRAVYIKNQLGAFRCYRGHQLALQACQSDHVLVLEDDAWPNRSAWMFIVERARELLETFQVVSLHGRGIRGIDRRIECGGQTYVTLKPLVRRRLLYRAELRWVQGSLAYLITAAAARRIAEAPYRGIPVDHLLANAFSFAVILRSPFDHDRRHGSLVEEPRQGKKTEDRRQKTEGMESR